MAEEEEVEDGATRTGTNVAISMLFFFPERSTLDQIGFSLRTTIQHLPEERPKDWTN